MATNAFQDTIHWPKKQWAWSLLIEFKLMRPPTELRFEGGQTISKRMQMNSFEVTADSNLFALNQGHFRVPFDGK